MPARAGGARDGMGQMRGRRPTLFLFVISLSLSLSLPFWQNEFLCLNILMMYMRQLIP